MCDYNSFASSFTNTDANPLSVVFFHEKNVDFIQRQLQKVIRNKMNENIDRQSDHHLLSIMHHVYKEFAYHSYDEVNKEVNILNKKVLEFIVPMVQNGIKQYKGYVKDASQLYVPMERGTSTTIKGENDLEFKSFF